MGRRRPDQPAHSGGYSGYFILYSILMFFRKARPKKAREKSPRRETPEGHLFRSIRHQASLFIFSVIWLFLRAAAFL